MDPWTSALFGFLAAWVLLVVAAAIADRRERCQRCVYWVRRRGFSNGSCQWSSELRKPDDTCPDFKRRP